MRVAYVQMQIRFGEKEDNLQHARDLLLESDADLFVLPELFNTGYLFLSKDEARQAAESIPNGPASEALLEWAREKNCFIVAGMAEKAGEHIFNSAVLFGPGGHLLTYRKIHLFNTEKICFEPGDQPFQVVDIDLARIGLMICFDWIFPESVRSLALQGAEVICHPANLVMPYCQDAMITRCLENSVFAVTANRVGSDVRPGMTLHFTGRSQVVAPRGVLLKQADETADEVNVVEIDPALARDKWINQHNHLLNDRRSNMYQIGRII